MPWFITSKRRGIVNARLLIAWVVIVGCVCEAQVLSRATLFENGRILTGDGGVIEKASVLVRDGLIEHIEKEIAPPFLSKVVDCQGKTITPGLINAWGSLGRLNPTVSQSATSHAWDAFDCYDRTSFRETLRRGVTTVYLAPGGGSGVAGTATIVQLVPGSESAAGHPITEHAALCVKLGSGDSTATRARTIYAVRKAFEKAIDYRHALEDYEEDVKEYVKKLKERKEKEEKESKNTPDEGSNEPKDSPPPKGESKKKSGSTIEGEPLELNDNRLDAMKALSYSFQPQRRRPIPKKAEDKESTETGEKGGKDKKEDEIKKPVRPPRDPESELFLLAIDHRFPLRIEAHRSADIENALALKREYNLEVIVEGATEAYLVAKELADENVTVVLGPVVRSDPASREEFLRHSSRNAYELTEAGVQWTVGSGEDGTVASRFLAFNAQSTQAFGVQRNWLETVTASAADVLKLGDRIGRIRAGLQADLVVWNGEPGAPDSTVERAYIAGKLVFLAPGIEP